MINVIKHLTIEPHKFESLFDSYQRFFAVIQEVLDIPRSQMTSLNMSNINNKWFIKDGLLYVENILHTYIIPSMVGCKEDCFTIGTINEYMFILVVNENTKLYDKILMLNKNLEYNFYENS